MLTFGSQILKPTQNHLFKVALLILLVSSISPQKNAKSNQDVEVMIQAIRSHYLSLMGKHSDWLKRILGVVKLELTYRQIHSNCNNDTCLYSIETSRPDGSFRKRRSIKNDYYLEKHKAIFQNSIDQIKEMDKMKSEFYMKETPTIQENPKPKEKEKPKEIEKPKESLDQQTLSTKSPEIHMSDCKGKYIHYCKNGAKCLYIDLLQEAVCICRKGFTGKRCVDFSLSDTVQSLREYEMKTVNVALLNKKEYESILSVMDATARFTFDANLKIPEEVKDILDMPMIN